MPYIKQEDRSRVRVTGARTAGELNYEITHILIDYLKRKGRSYATINDIIGAVEGAKAEFQRRVVASYEDQKIQENGDVY